jgi:8-oxo-dGTP diphosphatase
VAEEHAAPLVVVAAVVEQDGRFLVTRRPGGSHLAGYWEFPGGKCQPGESYAQALGRELREELGVDTCVQSEILVTRHAYDDRHVELHFYRCAVVGEPVALLGQEIRWVGSEELERLPFPPADAELIAALRRVPSQDSERSS